MISEKTIEELEKRKWLYILGARMRRVKEVRERCWPCGPLRRCIQRARRARTRRL